MNIIFRVLFIIGLSTLLYGCASDDSVKPNKPLPTRQAEGSLPWAVPASWEGGLPGMGGVNQGSY